MKRLTVLFERSVPLRFVVIGVINTAFSYSIFAVMVSLNLSVALASLLALIAGVLFSFFTQGAIVFGHLSQAAFLRFVATWAVLYLLNLTFIYALMALGANAYLAAAIATAPTTVISFVIQKRAVFRPARAASRRSP